MTAAAGADGGRDRARAARAVPRPDADREAGAARAARRRVLQRGGDPAGRLAGHATAATPRSSTCATAARSPVWPTTTSSRSRPGSAATARCALPQRPLAPELLGLVQHVAAYERLAATAAVTRDPRHGPSGAAGAIRSSASTGSPTSLLERLLGRRGRDVGGGAIGAQLSARTRARARRRRRQRQDRPRAGRHRAASCWRSCAAGGSSPHYVGVDGCVELLAGLLAEALSAAGLDAPRDPPAATAQIMVAGADLPEELAALRAAIERARLDASGWSSTTTRSRCCARAPTAAGASPSCAAAGSTASGSRPTAARPGSRRSARSRGDWGGGYDVGLAALMAAARSADGRGPRTILESAVPAYYELDRAVRRRPRGPPAASCRGDRLGELARVVFPAAEDDPVAAGIVRRLTDEVIAFATVGAAAARARPTRRRTWCSAAA